MREIALLRQVEAVEPAPGLCTGSAVSRGRRSVARKVATALEPPERSGIRVAAPG